MAKNKVNVKSLRFGNWLMLDGKPYQVYAIYPNSITLRNGNNVKDLVLLNDSRLEPIELTPDRYKQIGFVQMRLDNPNQNYMGNADKNFGYPVYYLNQQATLRCNSADGHTGYLFMDGLRVKANYVHELQNLIFTLNGDEILPTLEL